MVARRRGADRLSERGVIEPSRQEGRQPAGNVAHVTSVEHVRSVLAPLPRSYEVVVYDRIRWRVGSIVYVGFSRDEETLGFAFPKEEREALVASDPAIFAFPRKSDMRFNWVLARTAMLDDVEATEFVLDAWAMVVPQKVSRGWFEEGIVVL